MLSSNFVYSNGELHRETRFVGKSYDVTTFCARRPKMELRCGRLFRTVKWGQNVNVQLLGPEFCDKRYSKVFFLGNDGELHRETAFAGKS